ncbi:hypothetical protein DFH09DRAFT_1362250 [Mycena vulgaris]|nr:hypothetical protein DFH09DRAFT_1362250 [Mycena vulgaris]
MAPHLDTRLADYHPEPLNFNDNPLNFSTPGSESKVFSPNRAHKAEPTAGPYDGEQFGQRLDTLPQGLPGRRHPATAVAQMAGFALAGAILSVGHHVYYASLHLSPADGTTRIAGHPISRQKVTNFVATVFIFLVKLCLSQSISKAFDQRLWYTVRRSSMKLNGLDALFGVLGDPVAFLNFEMVWRAKVAAGLAFIAWTGTFGVIPVPGSLTVQSMETLATEDITVPTVDLAKNPVSGAIYSSSPIGNYTTPATFTQTVASKAVIEAEIATWTNPCGSDCSYNITFFAPSFSCSAPSDSAIQSRIPIWSLPGIAVLDTVLSQTTCSSFNSTYNIAIEFRDNVQKVEVLDVALGSSFGTDLTLINDPALSRAVRPALAALKDAVSISLTGSIFQNLQTGLDISGGTLALYSALANNTLPTNPVFRTSTPQLIEDLLTNTTISMISRNLWSDHHLCHHRA